MPGSLLVVPSGAAPIEPPDVTTQTRCQVGEGIPARRRARAPARGRDATSSTARVTDGPQVVTRHGTPTVAVVEISEFHRLQGRRLDFEEFLPTMPPTDDLELLRDPHDTAGNVEL